MGQDKSLKDRVKEKLDSNDPGTFGDPVSLKAETSERNPTESEKGSKQGKTLKQVAQETNPSMLGDPISLKAETSSRDPKPEEAGSKEKKRESKI